MVALRRQTHALACLAVWLDLEPGSFNNLTSTLALRIGKQFPILHGLEVDMVAFACKS